MTTFVDRVAVVTGASSGVGKSIALEIAARRANVCLLGRREAELESVAAQARERGGSVRCYAIDLTEERSVSEVAMKLVGHTGGVDVLVHAAGIISHGPVASAPLDELDRQYRTNLRAPYSLTQALLPMLRKAAGQVVFLNSSAGLRASARVSQYAATKHALKAMADSLREEVNPEGIRVLSVYLGRTATPMQAEVHRLEGRPYQPERLLQPEDVAAIVLSALSLPRTAEVTDISIRPMQKLPDSAGASPTT